MEDNIERRVLVVGSPPLEQTLIATGTLAAAPAVCGDADDFLDELDGYEPTVVHFETFTQTNGNQKQFIVKEFNQDDHLEIALGPLTFIDNEYVKKPRQEAKLSVALKVHRGIVKETGKDKNGRPVYAPLFSLKQIEGMYLTKEKGRFLDWALARVHQHNPSTNPLAKKKTETPKASA